MEEFQFTVEHRPGARHVNADALSRRPCPQKNCACRNVTQPLLGGPADQPSHRTSAVSAVNHGGTRPHQENSQGSRSAAETTVESSASDVADLFDPGVITRSQKTDPDIAFIYSKVAAGEQEPTWNDVSAQSHDTKVLWSFWSRLVIKDGVLMRRFDSEDGHRVSY